MGRHIAYTAIKTNDVQKTLDTLQAYYKTHNLELAEDKIGDRATLLPAGKKVFATLKDYYQEEIDPLPQKDPLFCTNFTLRTEQDTPELAGWVVLEYYMGKIASFVTSIDPALSRYVSANLSTSVIDYLVYDTVSQTEVFHYQNGEIVDEYTAVDIEIHGAKGFFEPWKDKSLESYDEQFEPIDKFFSKVGLPDVVLDGDLDYNATERPIYLRGEPKIIMDYLRELDYSFRS